MKRIRPDSRFSRSPLIGVTVLSNKQSNYFFLYLHFTVG